MEKRIIPLILLSFSANAVEVVGDLSEDIPDTYMKRVDYEEESNSNPFSLTAHKMNYILPYTYSESVNTSPYELLDDHRMSDSFKNEEAKIQLSIKVPIVKELFNESDKLYFGFTVKSFWQIYAEDASRPFRNTDYNPELFYMSDFKIKENQDNFFMLGVEHESNGQVPGLSRSWNRVYGFVGRDTSTYSLGLKTWYRIPEDSKNDPLDPKGDDNPDIGDYYGNFELTGIWKHNDYHYSAMGRYNVSTNKGYMELGATFKLYGNFKGYVQYVEGYGENLLDYDHYQRRIGVGIVISDIL